MIFVTGCARSGTSLTTKILLAHGCNLGPSSALNVLYENTDIRQDVLKPYLRSIGADPLGQLRLPDTWNLKPLEGLREAVLKRIPGKEPRAYKDAKLCLVWPIFADAFPEATWVLVRRDKQRIVDSCLRTDFMHSFRERRPWEIWVEEHEKRFNHMRSKLPRLIEVWPDDVVQAPETFRPVAEYCGLSFNHDATSEAVDHKLWHAAA